AREMRISASALESGVSRDTCKAENTSVVHSATNRRLSYGQLAKRASTLPVPTDPPLKQAKDYKIVGKPLPRLDTPSKVTGTATYGIDFRLPNMKFAVLARCPVFGGKAASFNDAYAKKVLGVSYIGKVGGAGKWTRQYGGSKWELWASLQVPQNVSDSVAQAVGLDPHQVKVDVTLAGGGFGRRLEHDYGVEAALVSKAINGPVQVLWTRE